MNRTVRMPRLDTVSAVMSLAVHLRGVDISVSAKVDKHSTHFYPPTPTPKPHRAPFGSGARSCLSSPVSGGGSGCGPVGGKMADPASPGSPGPSSPRPSTPLVNSVSPASSPQSAAAQLKNCLRSSQHTVNQARTSMQLGKQRPVQRDDTLLIGTGSLFSRH